MHPNTLGTSGSKQFCMVMYEGSVVFTGMLPALLHKQLMVVGSISSLFSLPSPLKDSPAKTKVKVTKMVTSMKRERSLLEGGCMNVHPNATTNISPLGEITFLSEGTRNEFRNRDIGTITMC